MLHLAYVTLGFEHPLVPHKAFCKYICLSYGLQRHFENTSSMRAGCNLICNTALARSFRLFFESIFVSNSTIHLRHLDIAACCNSSSSTSLHGLEALSSSQSRANLTFVRAHTARISHLLPRIPEISKPELW